MAGAKIESNMFLINAPAGSGKTHFIKDKINSITEKNPSVQILCITYTERAAKELQSRISSDVVFISTIHSFINSFISPYYAHSETIDLYYELYKNDIEKRIQENNTLSIDDQDNRNSKYLAAKGLEPTLELSIKLIKENTKAIYYNERSYNTLYHGGLSHDNLLEFAFIFLDKYPILQFRLREMFQYIFVDEVQDTHEKILRLFYNAVKDTSTKLYYFGDKMQEIYENYDGGFEVEFAGFDVSLSNEFKYNYRSNKEIVDVLNNLYKRKDSDKQESKIGCTGVLPILKICPNIATYYNEHMSDFDGFLVLRIANRARFARGNPNESMEDIFDAISDVYPHGSRVTAIDAMLPIAGESSPDPLVDFYYVFGQIENAFHDNHYAKVIQLLSNQTFVALDGRKKNIFHPSMTIKEHGDKARIQSTFMKALKEYANGGKYDLGKFLMHLVEQNVINDEFKDYVYNAEDDEGNTIYKQLLAIQLREMKRLISYKDSQCISTQHGVKGEGHPKVCFWSEDSKRNRPFVYMYDFFKMFSQLEHFNLESFQSFYYTFNTCIVELEQSLGMKINKMKSSDITVQNIDQLDRLVDKFNNNIYFNHIFGETEHEYKSKRKNGKLPTLKSVQAIFRPNIVNRILVAYKLFYVGCSRAKDELIVLVDQEGIRSFESEFKAKMSTIGFNVVMSNL